MALTDSNAFVSMSSSADQDYPASNILDPQVYYLLDKHLTDMFFHLIRSDNVFWMTTGLYPQEFIITFKEPIEFRQLRFVTTNGMSSRNEKHIQEIIFLLIKLQLNDLLCSQRVIKNRRISKRFLKKV